MHLSDRLMHDSSGGGGLNSAGRVVSLWGGSRNGVASLRWRGDGTGSEEEDRTERREGYEGKELRDGLKAPEAEGEQEQRGAEATRGPATE